MLNGQVFSDQLFESHIFALFVNTFLDGANGISENYKNGMAVTYSGSNVSIDTGAVVIQGRYLEEDAGTTIDAGSTSAYCKLVIQIDLDQINTTSQFNQGSYEVISDSSGYPTLTQQDIVNTNSGIYQYELARFQTTSSGITNFVDKRTFLDIEGLYETLQTQYATELTQATTDITDLKKYNNYVDAETQIGTYKGENLYRIIKYYTITSEVTEGTGNYDFTADLPDNIQTVVRCEGSYETSGENNYNASLPALSTSGGILAINQVTIPSTGNAFIRLRRYNYGISAGNNYRFIIEYTKQ